MEVGGNSPIGLDEKLNTEIEQNLNFLEMKC